jgi:exodeoxyribonuclease VII large subunit
VTGDAGISVSELNLMVSEAICRDPRTRSLTVRGEVSGFKHHIASGHWYFSLKDPEAAVSCVMFRQNTLRAKIRPKDGDSVLADGYVEVYAAQGKYQLYVTGIRPAGAGDIYVRLEELKRKLAAEGLFDPGRKKPLPMSPKKVAVVTSQSGAALHDILNVSGMRNPSVPIVLIPVAVQGAGAGSEIAAGIRKANETDADVIIVARGGGSAEDLWCFNDEAVARAVAASGKPVVSGVGHEVDVTLCDLAADVRASTPSNAAEIVFPDRRELATRVRLIRSSLLRAQAGRFGETELRLREMMRQLTALSPEKRILRLTGSAGVLRERLTSLMRSVTETKQNEVKAAAAALEQSTQRRLTEAQHTTARLRERLTAVNPTAVLNRGYAMVYSGEERLLTSAAEAKRHREMTLQFADGRVRVAGKEEA